MSAMNPGTGWGNGNAGAPFPLSDCGRSSFADYRAVNVPGCVDRMSLIRGPLRRGDRAAFFAARGGGNSTRGETSRQPGRERPRSGCPRLRPTAGRAWVAHAPAACLVCPDEVVRARAIDGTRCEYRNRQSDGHAQHVETVAAVVHIFPNRRVRSASMTRGPRRTNRPACFPLRRTFDVRSRPRGS
jgi:hypothetical protein